MPFEGARRSLQTVAIVLAALLGGTSAARAATPADRAAARQHAKQAQALKEDGKLAESCQHWEQVERLDPKLQTLMELAECTEKLGKLVAAQGHWAAARDRAKRDEKPQSRARAESRLAAVQKRVAHLTLQLAPNVPAGAQVLCDDVVVEPGSLADALPLDPGEHVVVVKLAGHDDAKYAVKLTAGESKSLPIAAGAASTARSAAPPAAAPAPALAPVPSAPPPAPSAPATPPPAAPAAPVSKGWWSSQRVAGVITGSAGIALLGGGSALAVVAHRDAKKQGDLVDARLSLGAASIVSGGVLLIAGVALLVSGSGDEASEQASVTLAPTLLVAGRATLVGAAGEF